jgi:hypothetical protein
MADDEDLHDEIDALALDVERTIIENERKLEEYREDERETDVPDVDVEELFR